MTRGHRRRRPARELEPNQAARSAAARKAKDRRQLFTWLVAGIVLAFLAVVGLIVWNESVNDNDGDEPSANLATIVPGEKIDTSIPIDGMALGDAGAPITVVEYGDYQCPHCVRFHRNGLDALMSEYIQPGNVRFEYREFPIVDQNPDGSFDTDAESFRAAEAAICAADQGQYWPYHNLLFANSHGESVGSFTVDRLKGLAERTPGIDLATFNGCVDNRTHLETVRQMANAAIAAGIDSTPTFVVNGRPIEGADYGAISDVIDEQLTGQ